MRSIGCWMMTVIVALATGCAKVEVVQVTPNASQNSQGTRAEGVFYALPLTVVRAQPTVVLHKPERAPYVAYADIFAPGNDPICPTKENPECAKQFVLKDGVALSTFGEPDPKNVYMVKFANGRTLDQALSMTWNEAGLASTASSSVTNRAMDITMAGIKLAAGIGARSFGASLAGRANQTVQCTPMSKNDAWVIPILRGTDEMKSEVSDTLVANYCALPQARRDQLVENDDRPLLTAARWAYFVRLEPLIDALNRQLNGSSFANDPVPIIGRIEGLISDQLKALYLGTDETKTWEAMLNVRATAVNVSEPLLFIDKANGVCVKGELAPESKPLPDAFKPAGGQAFCDKQKENVTLHVDYYPIQTTQLFSVVQTGSSAPTGTLSFRYRIPAQMKAEVRLATDKGIVAYGTGLFAIAQFGHVAALPAKRNAKTFSYDLAFVEATGGLKGFKLGSTGVIDAASVDALSGGVNSVLDARNTQRDKDKAEREKKDAAAAAEADELNILTRRAEILKLKDAICELQKKYGLTCESQ